MKKHLTKALAIIVGLVVVSVFGIYQYQVSRVSKNSEAVLFEVSTEGNGLYKTLALLEEEELIRSSAAAKVLSKMNGFDRVYAGLYNFNQSMSTYEILDMLNDPKAANQDIFVQLTEGFWARDMAAALSAITGDEDQDYLDLWNNPDFIKAMMAKYEFLPQEILELEDAKVLLEGYLYPDTYRINPKNTAEQATEIILRNGQAKFESISKEIALSDLSIHELYTLASIVEYEASKTKDMEMVAGVFMNRLEIDMPLQSSVTVCYTLYEFNDWTDCESAAGTQSESPYNTYRNKGLPPGPILNPSLKSINATLNYDVNDYLYFIADVYEKIDGEVHYQETYEEHEEVRMELLGY